MHLKCRLFSIGVAFAVGFSMATPGVAQDKEKEIQKQLSNPIASLTLVPFQFNYDHRIGPVQDGQKVTTNIQPVVPFKLSSELSVVVRTILPVIGQSAVLPGSGDQFGLGDTLQSFFFVPQTSGGFTWGAGPALLWRTGTSELLTSGKWAAGPTAVALQQTGPWTIGVLANHIWSFAGDQDRANVNSTYVQPFLAYAASGGWTYTLNTESTYDWETSKWSVPINFQIAKLTKIGELPVSLFGGVRYWADAPPDQGPEGWGARAGITFILP